MKKSLFIIPLFLFTFALMQAQVKVNFQIGINSAKQEMTGGSGNSSVSTGYTSGLNGGVLLDFGMGPVSFETGALYSQKGCQIISSGSTFTETLNYLDIPLRIIYKLNPGPIKGYLKFGPVISYGLSGNMTQTNYPSQPVTFGSSNTDYAPFDLSLQLGAGVQIFKVKIGIDYSLGLLNLYSNLSNANNPNSISLYNDVYTFYVEFML